MLDNGLYFIQSGPLLLKRWDLSSNLDKEQLESIPLWNKLPNLNGAFRTTKNLSRIASLIGNPLFMDSAATSGTNLAQARLCVEITPSTELPDMLTLITSRGTVYQRVEHDWKPKPCSTCNVFSHSNSGCPLAVKQPKQEWVKKQMHTGVSANLTCPASAPAPPLSAHVKGKSIMDETVKKAKRKNQNTAGVLIIREQDGTSMQSPNNKFSSLDGLADHTSYVRYGTCC